MSQQNLQVPTSTEAFEHGQQSCAGCHKSVNSETGSVVVAFGTSLWHVDCFRCAKCGDLVNAETPSLLLLSDGSPVCAKCYSCKICHKAILDEAVMAGEDSYHASCFKCRTCHRRIDELVFAKTSQGLYCMNCHNERVARHRKQAAIRKQKERDREAQAQGQGSINSRSSAGSGSGHGHTQVNDTNSPFHKHPSSGYVTPPPSSSEGHAALRDHVRRSDNGVNDDSLQPGPSFASDEYIRRSSNSNGLDTRGELVTESYRTNEHAISELSNDRSVSPGRMGLSQSGYMSKGKGKVIIEESETDNAASVNTPERAFTTPPPSNSASHLERNSSSNLSSSLNSVVSSSSFSATDSEFSEILPNPYENHLNLTRTKSADASSVKSFDTSVTMTPDSIGVRNGGNDSMLANSSHRRDDAPRQKAVDFDVTERKSLDDGVRPLNSFFSRSGNSSTSTSESSSSLSVPGVSSRAQKRRSINPGLQLNYSDVQRMRPSSPSSPSTSSTLGSGKALGVSTSSAPTSRDSPRTPSPLREYFVVNGINTLELGKDSKRASGATAYYSTSTSPRFSEEFFRNSLETSEMDSSSPHSAPPTQQLFSSGVYTSPPQRMESLKLGSNFESFRANSLATTEHSLKHSHLDDRHWVDLASDILLTDQQNGNNKTLGSPLHVSSQNQNTDWSNSRNRSGSNTILDVPHSIESGTDTETENENDIDIDKLIESKPSNEFYNGMYASDVPPTPPPKEHLTDQSPNGNNNSRGSIEEHDIGNESSEAGSPESSPVQHRRSLFFAPALPPIRFSMDQTDFSEILKRVAGSTQVVSPIVEEESALKPPSKTSETSLTSEEGNESQQVSVPVQDENLPVTPRPTETSVFSIGTNGETPKANKRIVRKPAPDALVLPVQDATSMLNQDSPLSPISAGLLPELPMKSPRRMSQKISSVTEEPSSHSVLNFIAGPPTTPVKDNGGRDSPRLYANPQALKTEQPVRERRPSKVSMKLSSRPSSAKSGNVEFVSRRLKEVYSLSREKKRDFIKLEPDFVDAILNALDESKEQSLQLSNKMDSYKRASQRMMDGLSVAQEEYDIQVAARREAEAEVTRLKVEIAGQAARITSLSSDERRRELQQQMSQEMVQNLSGLEKDLSQLKLDRDMTLAEMEELSSSKSEIAATHVNDSKANKLSRSLTGRFDGLKKQYQKELLPLIQQREKVIREIAELKEERDIFLAETTVLNKRNEELAELNTQYERRLENSVQETEENYGALQRADKIETPISSIDSHSIAPPLSTTTSTSSSATLHDDIQDARPSKAQKPETPEHSTGHSRSRGIGLRWPGNKGKDAGSPSPGPENKKLKARLQHSFHQMNVLRFSRCDQCGEKLFGSQLRCSSCSISIHPRCVHQMQMPCLHDSNTRETVASPGPSMFGRDLSEQVQADSKGDNRLIPVIVEKCIEAVETLGMDYEGIYRKTGGSSQSKLITQLFERGNYDAFDLRDTDFFNDISSVTSVLKTYFRTLPDPLLTYELHESFVAAAGIRDPVKKSSALSELVVKLPQEHYHTLCCLMLHLHRVQLQSDQNLMTARNLGVVFGPTLMRSPDPGREFADMAGKALSVEWLIENAPNVFSNTLVGH